MYRKYRHSGHCGGIILLHLLSLKGMNTVHLQLRIMVSIFVGMYVGSILTVCVKFCNFNFLCGCGKSHLEACACTHASAGWKDFLDYITTIPVYVPVVTKIANADNQLMDGIAILHQVSVESGTL